MDALLPELPVPATTVDQVGLVVRDLEAAMDRYGAVLGVGPWQVKAFEPPELTGMTYHGEPAEFGLRLAIATPGAVDVELIEPTLGPTIYADHLDAHGPGLHHVACFGWDPEEAERVVDAFVEAGMPVLMAGEFRGSRFWYLDTREALDGLVFETVARRGGSSEPDAVYPDDPYPYDG